MLSWFIDNIATIIVSAMLVLILGLALLRIIKDKKSGKSGCGCGCDGCALSEQCHSKKNERK